jgi:hypothetical protein
LNIWKEKLGASALTITANINLAKHKLSHSTDHPGKSNKVPLNNPYQIASREVHATFDQPLQCGIHLCSGSCLPEFLEELESQMQEFSHCQFRQHPGYPVGPVRQLAGSWPMTELFTHICQHSSTAVLFRHINAHFELHNKNEKKP